MTVFSIEMITRRGLLYLIMSHRFKETARGGATIHNAGEKRKEKMQKWAYMCAVSVFCCHNDAQWLRSVLITAAATGLQHLATSLLPTACSKTNRRPLLWSCLCSTWRRLSGQPFKYASLTSIFASSSSSLPSIPPSLAFFPDKLRLVWTLVFHLCHVCFCAFEIQLSFFFEFYFFFWDSFFFFLQGPLLMQFPVILLALSLYLNFGGGPRSGPLRANVWHQQASSCERGTLPLQLPGQPNCRTRPSR